MSSFCPKLTAKSQSVLGSWQGLAVNRAIVLVVCLLAAAGIAGYTHFSERAANQTPVYTVMVPQRPPEQAAPVQPPQPPGQQQKATATPGDRASLARELQRELKRVGCYSGEITGVWTTSSRMAMKSFTDNVNATLPIDNPDYILLSLVQGRQGAVCGTTEAKTDTKAAPVEKSSATPPPATTTTTTIGAAVPAAAAVTALSAAAPAATPKADAKLSAPDDRPRSAAISPPPAEPPAKTAQPERAARVGGPVPSTRVYGRRSHRYSDRAASRPPKFVRNFLKVFGMR